MSFSLSDQSRVCEGVCHSRVARAEGEPHREVVRGLTDTSTPSELRE